MSSGFCVALLIVRCTPWCACVITRAYVCPEPTKPYGRHSRNGDGRAARTVGTEPDHTAAAGRATTERAPIQAENRLRTAKPNTGKCGKAGVSSVRRSTSADCTASDYFVANTVGSSIGKVDSAVALLTITCLGPDRQECLLCVYLQQVAIVTTGENGRKSEEIPFFLVSA